MRNISLLMCVV